MSKYLITTIAAKKKSDFVDPFSPEGLEEDKMQEQPPPESVQAPIPKSKARKVRNCSTWFK